MKRKRDQTGMVSSPIMSTCALCWLCTTRNEKNNMILIFSIEGKQEQLCEKICNYTPFKVEACNNVSAILCKACVLNINNWHSFVQYCIKAQQDLTNLVNSWKNSDCIQRNIVAERNDEQQHTIHHFDSTENCTVSIFFPPSSEPAITKHCEELPVVEPSIHSVNSDPPIISPAVNDGSCSVITSVIPSDENSSLVPVISLHPQPGNSKISIDDTSLLSSVSGNCMVASVVSTEQLPPHVESFSINPVTEQSPSTERGTSVVDSSSLPSSTESCLVSPKAAADLLTANVQCNTVASLLATQLSSVEQPSILLSGNTGSSIVPPTNLLPKTSKNCSITADLLASSTKSNQVINSQTISVEDAAPVIQLASKNNYGVGSGLLSVNSLTDTNPQSVNPENCSVVTLFPTNLQSVSTKNCMLAAPVGNNQEPVSSDGHEVVAKIPSNLQSLSVKKNCPEITKSPLRPQGTYCIAKWCRNNAGQQPNLSRFRVPNDKSRAEEWLRNAGREDLLHEDIKLLHTKYMCQEHFTDEMFMNSNHNRLVWNAVPTLFTEPKSLSSARPCSSITYVLDVPQASVQVVHAKAIKPERKILPKNIQNSSSLHCVESGDYNFSDLIQVKAKTKRLQTNKKGWSKMNDSIKKTQCQTVKSTKNNQCDLITKVTTPQPVVSTVKSSSDLLLTEANQSFITNEVDNSLMTEAYQSFITTEVDIPCLETSEPKYTCTFCGEMFLMKSSLIMHQTTYHPGRPVNCELCGQMEYRTKAEFLEHVCSAHTS